MCSCDSSDIMPYTARPTTADADGIVSHAITSKYQDGETVIQVLLPGAMSAGRRCSVLYILPVNPGTIGPWGSGIGQARKNDLANKHGIICVEPSFARYPWYADHPTNPVIAQASYMTDVVVPFIDKTYPTLSQPQGRLLVGFSKSGWGAFSLLLSYPHLFGRAASWDGCLMLDDVSKFGVAAVYGTAENFAKRKVSALVEQNAELLKDKPARLAVVGYGNFKEHQEKMHLLLTARGIAHYYDNATIRTHDWASGWLPQCVAILTAADMTNPSGSGNR